MRSRVVPVAALGAVLAACAADPPAADVVFRGGVVRTMVRPGDQATALVVTGDTVAFVGSDSAAAPWIGRRTRVIELAGRALLPGFRDAHVHPVKGGRLAAELDLSEAETVGDAARAISRYATDHPGRPWITGRGWPLPLFPGANPGRLLLDSLVPDRPAYLVAQDGHSAWVNSAALAAAGITRTTPDPAGGRIERDASGRPSGTLRESAMGLVGRLLPAPTAADDEAALARALAEAARLGITSLHEASAEPAHLAAYAALARRGELTARLTASVALDPDTLPLDPTVVPAPADPGLPGFRVTGYKLFLDGVIEAHTAALLEPYLDRPRDRGPTRMLRERLFPLVAELDRRGVQLTLHAIGDRAVRDALDAVAHARRLNGTRGPAPLVAHVQLVHPDDVSRFAALGAVAVIQPLWAYRDRYIVDLTEPRLGPARSRRIYPFGDLAAAGAPLAAGSDWPVTSLDPWRGIAVAVTRRAPGTSGPPWLPDQALDLWTALRAYTAGGAAALGEPAGAGTLVPGAPADLIVVDLDPFTVEPHRLHERRVELTMVGGRIVFEGGNANRRTP